MDAYNREILTKEMNKQDQEWRFNDISRVSFLAEKRAIIEKIQDDKIVPRVKKFAGRVMEGAAVQMLAAGVEITNIFEPGFMRRARQRRRHLGRIAQAEADADRVIVSSALQPSRLLHTPLSLFGFSSDAKLPPPLSLLPPAVCAAPRWSAPKRRSGAGSGPRW